MIIASTRGILIVCIDLIYLYCPIRTKWGVEKEKKKNKMGQFSVCLGDEMR